MSCFQFSSEGVECEARAQPVRVGRGCSVFVVSGQADCRADRSRSCNDTRRDRPATWGRGSAKPREPGSKRRPFYFTEKMKTENSPSPHSIDEGKRWGRFTPPGFPAKLVARPFRQQ